MKTALGLLAVVTILAAPSLSATQSGSPAVLPGIQESAGELSPDVQRYLGRGDDLISRLRFDAAAREYARAAGVARREGHLSSLASWKAANAFYYDGNLMGAAAVLDKLANDAALVGDLEVEALSIYYAAWVDGNAGRGTQAAARVARLEALLRSRYMPVEIRDRLGGWLRTSRDVASIGSE